MIRVNYHQSFAWFTREICATPVVDHAFYEEGHPREMVPTRVIPNGEGSELTYTMFQKQGVSDEEFASTLHWVEADFLALA